jgi:hypothetical protein
VAAFLITLLLRRERERHPQLRLAVGKRERVVHHADDTVALAVEMNIAADNARVRIELVAPQRRAEHGDTILADFGRVGAEYATNLRFDLERREQRRRRDIADQALRRALVGEVEAFAVIHGQIFERRSVLAPVEKVRNRRAGVLEIHLRIGVVDVDQALAVRIRQRPQQHAVDDAEDRAVRADAEARASAPRRS